MHKLLLSVLAVYRISRMLALEEGPFSVFARARSAVGGDTQETWLGRGVNCPLCLGFWIAGLLTLLLKEDALFWLGIAGGAAFLQEKD